MSRLPNYLESQQANLVDKPTQENKPPVWRGDMARAAVKLQELLHRLRGRPTFATGKMVVVPPPSLLPPGRPLLPIMPSRPLVYFVRQDGDPNSLIKIGHVKDEANLTARIRSLQTANGRKLIVLATMPGGVELESELHVRFAASRMVGEWFTPCAALLDLISSAGGRPV